MKYYVLDIETSGLKPGFHEITEISILRCADMVQRVWLLNIKYPKRFSKQALMVTGQDVNDILKRKKYIENAIPEINGFLEEDGDYADGRVIIAHNGAFDRNQIEHNWDLYGQTFPANYWIDSKEMARKYIKRHLKLGKRQSVALSKVLELFKINAEPGAHSAEVDVRNTFRLWKYLEKRGMSNIEFTKLSPKLINDDMRKLHKKADINEQDAADVWKDLEEQMQDDRPPWEEDFDGGE